MGLDAKAFNSHLVTGCAKASLILSLSLWAWTECALTCKPRWENATSDCQLSHAALHEYCMQNWHFPPYLKRAHTVWKVKMFLIWEAEVWKPSYLRVWAKRAGMAFPICSQCSWCPYLLQWKKEVKANFKRPSHSGTSMHMHFEYISKLSMHVGGFNIEYGRGAKCWHAT